MQEARIPADEEDRLAALAAYDVLDTLPEQAYDDISFLAAQVCETPIALVSLVDDSRQWFKSHHGLDVSETPRDRAFCAHAILEPGKLFIVEDATADPRFADNPLVQQAPAIRFYAGAPLVTSDGHALGTLCVIDQKPRGLSRRQRDTLHALSRQVIAQLELRRNVAELEARNQHLRDSRTELAELVRILDNQNVLIERDLQRAEIIQRSLLPQRPPTIDGFTVKSLYRPGRAIGGDLYDVVKIGDRYLALVVADASGHGVSAAMLSVLFKQHLKLKDDSTDVPYGPAWSLTRLNASLVADRPAPGVFVTAAYALLNIETRELTVGSAGHPPVIVRRQDGSLETVLHTGPALGLDRQATYAEQRVQLQAGDAVLMYTDGLLDMGSEAPGSDRLGELLGTHLGDAKPLETLLVDVTRGEAREDCDDVTMLLLHGAEGASHFTTGGPNVELKPLSQPDAPNIWRARSSAGVFFAFEGRLTWLFGQSLLDAALEVLATGDNLILDFADCEYIDSTLLGTLHEIVQNSGRTSAIVTLQNVGSGLLADFDELSMTAVINHMAYHAFPVPLSRTPLEQSSATEDENRERLLRAHEVLSGLSESNREQFSALLATLRTGPEATE